MKKIALLDTDLISKAHIVQTDADNHLIDRILELSGYEFYCHEQTVMELGRHNAMHTHGFQERYKLAMS